MVYGLVTLVTMVLVKEGYFMITLVYLFAISKNKKVFIRSASVRRLFHIYLKT